MTEFVKPFRVGDKVRLSDGAEAIISGSSPDNPYRYTTSVSSWHDHKTMTLVEECNEANIEELRRAWEEEYGDEDE